MSIRVLLCGLYVLFFAFYAGRNWFTSLCALILLMTVFQHPDMPKSIAGIQGLNLWNILLFSVLVGWLKHRNLEGLTGDMPRYLRNLLILYFCVITVSFLRLFLNAQASLGLPESYVVSEYFINCIKWVLPGFLLFSACRTRKRVLLGLISLLGVYFLLAVLVIRWMPLGTAVSGDFSGRAAKIVQNEIGYNRVTLSMMLGGASWAILSLLVVCKKRLHQCAVLGAAAIVSLGQALTGGRTGYVAWGIVGLILCVVRWRRLLPVIPIAVISIMIFLPGVRDRMLQGFVQNDGNIIVHNDDYKITSGRTLAWPLVIKKIGENPIFGYGREAMMTTGIYQEMVDENGEGDAFPHPHNAYLEVLLDSGILGFLGVIPFYLVALWHGFRLLLDRQDPLAAAVGGVACALILALLAGAMGGQTFYPREGAVGLWAALGIMFRVSLERARARASGLPLFGEEHSGETPGISEAFLEPAPSILKRTT